MIAIPFGSDYIWTEDNEYVSVGLDSDAPVSVQVVVMRQDDVEIANTTNEYRPYQKKIKLLLCEILRGLLLSDQGEFLKSTVSVKEGGKTYYEKSFYVIVGSSCGLSREKLLSTQILTQCPQASYRLKSSEDPMFCFHISSGTIAYTDAHDVRHRVQRQSKCIKIYMSNGSVIPIEEKIEDKPSTQAHIEPIDVSYANMTSLAKRAGNSSRVVAADVWLKAQIGFQEGLSNGWEKDVEGNPIRLIYREADTDDVQYRFLNAFGVYESIVATGAIFRLSESDKQGFVSCGREQELIGKTVHHYEQNTGYLSSEDEVLHWYAFLASKSRFISDGHEYRPIILTEQDTKFLLKETGSLRFTWHYAETDTMSLPKMRKLDTLVAIPDVGEPDIIDDLTDPTYHDSNVQETSPNDNLWALLFSPFDNKLYKSSLGQIKTWIGAIGATNRTFTIDLTGIGSLGYVPVGQRGFTEELFQALGKEADRAFSLVVKQGDNTSKCCFGGFFFPYGQTGGNVYLISLNVQKPQHIQLWQSSDKIKVIVESLIRTCDIPAIAEEADVSELLNNLT